jgi:acyl carrier protein
MVKTDDEILCWLRNAMKESFQLDPERIRPESHLLTDLGLDSIDEVELALRMQTFTGRRLDATALPNLSTVQDVVDIVHQAMEA